MVGCCRVRSCSEALEDGWVQLLKGVQIDSEEDLIRNDRLAFLSSIPTVSEHDLGISTSPRGLGAADIVAHDATLKVFNQVNKQRARNSTRTFRYLQPDLKSYPRNVPFFRLLGFLAP